MPTACTLEDPSFLPRSKGSDRDQGQRKRAALEPESRMEKPQMVDFSRLDPRGGKAFAAAPGRAAWSPTFLLPNRFVLRLRSLGLLNSNHLARRE